MDLGANIGAYTKLLGTLVGAEGRVYSVEPIPSTFELLGCNIERYKLRNVKPINAAVSDEIRTVEMEVPEYEHGGENFYQATIVSGRTSGRRRFMVRTTTVDTICSERVHFIKCDVEGHESAVIRGASQTIQRHRPAWMVEVSKPEVLMAMRSMGYQAFLYDGTALRSQTDQDHPVNSFFLTDAHLELLRKRGMSL
jgi:FkbM family methyltransferase